MDTSSISHQENGPPALNVCPKCGGTVDARINTDLLAALEEMVVTHDVMTSYMHFDHETPAIAQVRAVIARCKGGAS